MIRRFLKESRNLFKRAKRVFRDLIKGK